MMAPRPSTTSTRGADDDLMNQRVKRPIRLKGDDADTARRKENQAAIGGMRNPRLSVSRVPDHKVVGKRAYTVIDEFVAADASMGTLVFKALGDGTKMNEGPANKQVSRIRQGLYKAFDLRYVQQLSGRSELDAQLYEDWVDRASDPEKDVVQWFRRGAPMGIDENMTPEEFSQRSTSRPLNHNGGPWSSSAVSSPTMRRPSSMTTA